MSGPYDAAWLLEYYLRVYSPGRRKAKMPRLNHLSRPKKLNTNKNRSAKKMSSLLAMRRCSEKESPGDLS